jgi:hypothetical protein
MPIRAGAIERLKTESQDFQGRSVAPRFGFLFVRVCLRESRGAKLGGRAYAMFHIILP